MVDRTGQQDQEYEYDWQNPNLVKFDFGRVMTRTFQGALYGVKAFWLPILLIFGIPMFLIGLWPLLLPDGFYRDIISGDSSDFGDGFEDILSPINLLIGALGFFIYIFAMTVIYIVAAHNIYGFYTKSMPSFQQSLQRGLSRFWVTIGASILAIFGVLLGTLLFIIPGILLALGWYLMVPIIAVEDKGPVETLSHSWEISKGSKRWILLLVVVLSVISGIASLLFSVITIPFGNAATALFEGGTPTFWVLNAFGEALAQIITFFLTMAGLMSVYYEIQFIKNGLVPENLSDVFD